MSPPKIPNTAASYLPLEVKGKLAEVEAIALGIHTTESEQPYVALKYFQPGFECFSEWDRDQLKGFSSFLEKLRSTSWDTIFKTGGKLGNKSGFGQTYHKDRSKLPECDVLKKISPEINFFELRVSKEIRVHGFRAC